MAAMAPPAVADEPAEQTEKSLASGLVFLGDKSRIMANLAGVNADGMMTAPNPANAEENAVFVGENNTTRRRSSMAEQRFCKP